MAREVVAPGPAEAGQHSSLSFDAFLFSWPVLLCELCELCVRSSCQVRLKPDATEFSGSQRVDEELHHPVLIHAAVPAVGAHLHVEALAGALQRLNELQ